MEMLILFSRANKYLKGHTLHVLHALTVIKTSQRLEKIRALCYSIINSATDDKVEKSMAPGI